MSKWGLLYAALQLKHATTWFFFFNGITKYNDYKKQQQKPNNPQTKKNPKQIVLVKLFREL